MTRKTEPTNAPADSSSKKPLAERLFPPWLRAAIWSIWGTISALAIIGMMVGTLLWLAGACSSPMFLSSSVQPDSDRATASAQQTATANASQLTATAEADASQLAATANASQLTATAEANALQLATTAGASQLTATADASQLAATANASRLTATANARLLQTSTSTPTPQGVINGPRGLVNVRSGPGSVYAPPLGTLSNGTVVDILGKQFSIQGELWWLISFPAGPDGKGWVLASYVTANNVTNVPWVTAPPAPTNTPDPPPARSTRTPISFGARPGPTRTPTSTPAPTPTSTPVPPVVTIINPPPSAPRGLPRGVLTLISPLDLDRPSQGLTVFEWEWEGDTLPPRFGFEVSVWLEGEFRAGVHNAVKDNGPDGEIEQIGENRYRLRVMDLQYATGVLGRTGTYLWTIGLVQVNPKYVDYGLEANPAHLRYENPEDQSVEEEE